MMKMCIMCAMCVQSSSDVECVFNVLQYYNTAVLVWHQLNCPFSLSLCLLWPQGWPVIANSHRGGK